jgi:hypothetical protein
MIAVCVESRLLKGHGFTGCGKVEDERKIVLPMRFCNRAWLYGLRKDSLF